MTSPRVAPSPRTTLIAIGASAGGPPALATVLGALPAGYQAAIVVVQHVDARFAANMATWLAEQTPLPVQVAPNGAALQTGAVLLAAGTDVHLTVTSSGILNYVRAAVDASSPHFPSIDVFFRSVAAQWRGPAVGVLLTGMGSDGASGLRAMRDAGAVTIAQDEASSAVYGMPKAAVNLSAASEVLPIDGIGPRLLRLAQQPPLPMHGVPHG